LTRPSRRLQVARMTLPRPPPARNKILLAGSKRAGSPRPNSTAEALPLHPIDLLTFALKAK